MVSMDLFDFLRARLDDDERAAKAWLPLGNPTTADRDHPARHDPARVLREVEAKRRILDLHTGVHDCPEMRTGVYPADWPAAAAYGKPGEHWAYQSTEHFDADEFCPTLRLLALPHADHPDYRADWRP